MMYEMLRASKIGSSATNQAVNTIANQTVKNLLPCTATTDTLNAVDFTVAADGSVTVSGTASSNTTFAIKAAFSLPVGKYILSGCPAGGATASYLLQMRNDTTQQNVFCQTSGAETSFSIDDPTRKFIIMIRIAKSYHASNLVFKPMIRRADIKDSTYQPYAPTNRELYEMILALQG